MYLSMDLIGSATFLFTASNAHAIEPNDDIFMDHRKLQWNRYESEIEY